MRFNHKFTLLEESNFTRKYVCDDTLAQIDFISQSAIRVAMYKKDCEMLPTFTVNPNNDLSHLVKKKLSSDGIKM